MASERDPGVDRIIAFSDGVVAIAITLLILPLTEIDRTEDATLGNVIVDNQTALFAFALSFAVIANYWTIHHSILQPLRRHNPRLIQLNLIWLALIVFLPFPTALIADGLNGGFATLYIGALLAVSILSLLLLTYLIHHPELTDGEATAESRGHLTASWFSIAALPWSSRSSRLRPGSGLCYCSFPPKSSLDDCPIRRPQSQPRNPEVPASRPACLPTFV
jgi:uncharacterized membrane protein